MPLIRRNVTSRRSRAAAWARLAGGLALPVLLLGVGGMRVGVVPQSALEPVLVVGFALGLAALGLAVYSLTDIWISGAEGAGSAFVAIFYASPVLVVLGLVTAAVIAYPRLSDISTDLGDPPPFVTSAAMHGALDPDGMARQEAGYPDLTPRLYPLPLGDVYAAVRSVIDANCWTVTGEFRPQFLPSANSSADTAPVVAEDEELKRALAAKTVMTQSRGGVATEAQPVEAQPDTRLVTPDTIEEATIEAVAPTPIFGFIDDVVIRLEVTDDGSTQVDMRSASRSGEHDLGQNARRIKGFFTKLDALLQPEPGATGSGVASAGQ